jgi:hypothetical protein
MGFFDSKTTTESTSTYDNPELRQYTAAYRGAAPWGFASMDPQATLFAMGSGTKLGGTDLGQGAKDYLKGLSDQDKQQQQSTNDALARIKTRQESGNFLTPQETQFINTSLDKAFEYAHATGIADWTKATQMLAGSRGLRMSDTPVAQPALQQLQQFEVGLGSERAKQGLAATLDMGKNQNNFDMAFAQFNQQLQQNKWATQQGFLFGGGLQAAGQLGFKTTQNTTTTNKMSGFQQVMAGFTMANATLDLGGRLAGGYQNGLSSLAPKQPQG